MSIFNIGFLGGWRRFGRLLGFQVGAMLAILDALGRFLAAFWTFGIQLFLSMGPRQAPKGLLDRFWTDFGRIWEALGRIWANFWKDFGQILVYVGNWF